MTLPLVHSIIVGGVLSLTGFASLAHAEPVNAPVNAPQMTMYKDPYCGCCEGWANHMKAAGFDVTVKVEEGMDEIKAKHGVPETFASCHTAIVDGYVIEGHVPAGAVKKLLAEHPAAKVLTAPGMPMGSPGMEIPGKAADTYDVLLFDGKTARPFARYEGTNAL